MKTYTASRAITATPEQAWELITNPSDFSWRSQVSSASDEGASYSETHSRTNYTTTYTIVRDEPPRSRETTFEHVDGNGTRSFTLRPGADGTTVVKIVEEFDSHGPRILGPLIGWFIRNQQKVYLQDLERALT